MRKFIILGVFLSAFAFDIDDLDRAVELLNAPEPSAQDIKEAYEILSVGCEAKDVLACEELGLMYINDQVTPQMDAQLAKHTNLDLGVGYLTKSCDLGYLNSCGDILNLRDQMGLKLDDGVYENAKTLYEEFAKDMQDINATK